MAVMCTVAEVAAVSDTAQRSQLVETALREISVATVAFG
jgi:hypothetical protein